jgi:uncharacterized protein YciI
VLLSTLNKGELAMELLQFIGLARPKRENFVQNMTDEEKAVFAEHFAYVEKLHSERKLVISGACLDGAFGMIIYHAETETEARAMFDNDPLTKSDITATEFHPFKAGHM